MSVLACILAALEAYLIGSVVPGILLSKYVYHDDVRTHGSGSAGMTNMIRNYGRVAGTFTAIGDIGKGVLAVTLGRLVFAWLLPGGELDPVCGMYLASIFVMIGHTKPLYFGFKGGKGLLAGAGSVLVTEPVVVTGLTVIWFIAFFSTKIVSVGSILVAALYPFVTVAWVAWRGASAGTLIFIGICTCIMAAMLIYMHRENIQRLRNGTEYRFGQKKK